MLKTETIQPRKNLFKKKVTYIESIREGSTAIKKEAIISVLGSEAKQINVMLDALVEIIKGDTELLNNALCRRVMEMQDARNKA
jgi:hypothetical protein